MSLIKYVERINRIDSLINLKSTGSPAEFARKLGIKRSTLFLTLQEMREIGVDIRYSWYRQSYYYADERRINITLVRTVREEVESEAV
jgi:hypothetical protein